MACGLVGGKGGSQGETRDPTSDDDDVVVGGRIGSVEKAEGARLEGPMEHG